MNLLLEFILFYFFIIVDYSIFRDSKKREFMDPVHGPSSRRGFHGPGSMFCTFNSPFKHREESRKCDTQRSIFDEIRGVKFG